MNVKNEEYKFKWFTQAQICTKQHNWYSSKTKSFHKRDQFKDLFGVSVNKLFGIGLQPELPYVELNR
jgi:hypothetical protein